MVLFLMYLTYLIVIFVLRKVKTMSITIKFPYLFILLCCSLGVKSQQFMAEDYTEELSITLSVIDGKRLEKGTQILNNAFKTEQVAINLIESLPEDEKLTATHPNYKKAIKRLVQISESYKEGHLHIYNVFLESCVKAQTEMKKMRGYSSGLNKAKLYERKSTQAYNRATSIRELLLIIEKPELIQYKMAEAIELEKLAIQHRGRALQIYQDFPVEYNYNWENDITPEEVEAAFRDPAISRPPDDLFVQKETTNQKAGGTKEPPITFKVQIAAHTLKMEEEYIRQNIYSGNMEITEKYEGGWYKYSIGSFSNFNEANDLLKRARVAKSFIVAYQEGKKLTIKSALEKIKQNQQ